MEFIKKYWILLLILIIGIYLLYNYWKKSKIVTINTPLINKSNNYSSSNVSNSNNLETIKNEVINFDYKTFKVFDKIYAGQSPINTYKSEIISGLTLSKSFKQDEIIGTYISKNDKFLKVVSGINTVYIPILNNKLYTK